MSIATEAKNDVSAFVAHESAVRFYCRKFPAVFCRGRGSWLYDEAGNRFLDFFCGAGSLNYGHNPEPAKKRLLEYIAADGVLHGLDMHTAAKREFLTNLQNIILEPLGLPYKVQFTGPTGADAVEAALKLARKATGRRTVIAFTGAYHGMSAGALSVTGGLRARMAGGVGLTDVMFVPYEDGPGGPFDAIAYLERMFADGSGGVGLPAAVIVEAVQIEGGIYPASSGWLRALRDITAANGIVMIVDDIQAGCGRTGEFFGFTHAGIRPDLVTLSKSIGGCGLPLSVLLIAAGLDVWRPGEHSGTFRGNQLAFLAGATMLEEWRRPDFLAGLRARAATLEAFGAAVGSIDPRLTARGRGMLLGIDTSDAAAGDRAAEVQRYCFQHGLILELCGRADSVVKLMPALTITEEELDLGLRILREAVERP